MIRVFAASENLAAVLRGLSQIEVIAADGDPIAQIADTQPALILFDGAALPVWAAESRYSPAARRIPALAVGGSPEAARAIEVHLFVSEEDFLSAPYAVIERYAKATNRAAEIAAGCAEPLPEMARRGLHEFNAGEYFEAHETLEAAWNAEAGPVRETYRAVLQIAVAYHHVVRGNYNGAVKMFLRSLQWFAPLPEQCQGIDIAGLRADAAAVRAALEALGPDRIAEFDRALLRPVRFDTHTNGKHL